MVALSGPATPMMCKDALAIMGVTIRHVVKTGDYLVKIAFEHGTTVAAIWQHPDNAALRAQRGSPDILYPGDVLFIPDQPEPPPPQVPPGQPPPPPPQPPPAMPPKVDETGAPWPYPAVEVPNPDRGQPMWCTHEECQCHPLEESEPETRRIIFFDHDGERLPLARCRILYNGRLLNLDQPYAKEDGSITFEVAPDAHQLLLEWAPENTPLGRPYPYRVRYYLDVDESDGVRLHQLRGRPSGQRLRHARGAGARGDPSLQRALQEPRLAIPALDRPL
ncbi:MAG: LysM peptidoglycan-binding domain-containing protein [Polyangiaceae bacterium]